MSKENLNQRKTLKPKNDVVFQSLFNKNHEEITKNFVEGLLGEKIYNLKINEDKELYREKPEEKLGILDLELDINNNEKVDVEIQLSNMGNFSERILFYIAKRIISQIQRGDNYNKLKRTVLVAIIDYNLELTKEIKEVETKWKLLCKKYPNLELTNKLEIIIIELSKTKNSYNKNKNDEQSQWLLFLDNPDSEEVKEIMEKNEKIKEAVIEVHKMSEDEKIQRLADLREKERLDRNSLYSTGMEEGVVKGEKKGMAKGLEQGIKQGLEKGIKQGENKRNKEIAKKLLERDMSIDEIKEITGLTEEEIKKC